MKGPRWTEADIATVTRMRVEGRTDIEIGAAIGRTARAVEGQVHRLKVRGDEAKIESHKRRSTWTAANIVEAHRLRDEGMTRARTGRRFGTTASYVGKMLAHVGDQTIDTPSDEPVQVSKIRMDPRQIVRELEAARAALVRAERRYDEVMEPIHRAMRAAITDAKLPWFDMAEPDRDVAEYLCAALRDRGFIIVEASRA